MIHTVSEILAREGIEIENGCVPASSAAKALLKSISFTEECLHLLNKSLKLAPSDENASRAQLEVKAEIITAIEIMQQSLKSNAADTYSPIKENVVSIFSVKKTA